MKNFYCVKSNGMEDGIYFVKYAEELYSARISQKYLLAFLDDTVFVSGVDSYPDKSKQMKIFLDQIYPDYESAKQAVLKNVRNSIKTLELELTRLYDMEHYLSTMVK